MPLELWQKCIDVLQDELSSQQFNTWIRPLKVMGDEYDLCLLAPNRFVADWVKEKFLPRVEEILDDLSDGVSPAVALAVSNRRPLSLSRRSTRSTAIPAVDKKPVDKVTTVAEKRVIPSNPLREQLSQVDSKSAQVTVKSKQILDKIREKKAVSSQTYQQPSLLVAEDEIVITTSSEEIDIVEQSESVDFDVNLLLGGESQVKTDDSAAMSSMQTLSLPVMPRAKIKLHQSTCENSVLDKHLMDKLNGNHIQSVTTLGEDYAFQETTLQVGDSALLLGDQPSLISPLVDKTIVTKQEDYDSVDAVVNETEVSRAEDELSTDKTTQSTVAIKPQHSLNRGFTFDTFVEGSSNELALSAARQVALSTSGGYNPLFIYGGVGLGKTHLMQAVGNHILQKKADARVVYLHSERFVADMVKALQLNAIADFKKYYRSVDALLIDDIQFFAGKERSQEEFFHTFNALLEGGQQIILTCDRYPKELKGLEERLKSRFGWGLTVAIEPPELDTRVAILRKKAQQQRIVLPDDAAFFLAQRIRSNVRELEGALKRVIASAHFMGKPISIELIRESLKDLLALQEKQINIDNIQRSVAEYYKIKVSDILSKRRTRTVARPRQLAMALSKELTTHSFPEIGGAFGGRDHTTVLHACRKVKELIEQDSDFKTDYSNLLQSLTN